MWRYATAWRYATDGRGRPRRAGGAGRGPRVQSIPSATLIMQVATFALTCHPVSRCRTSDSLRHLSTAETLRDHNWNLVTSGLDQDGSESKAEPRSESKVEQIDAESRIRIRIVNGIKIESAIALTQS
ncbi:hypothetical protein EVAR_11987_1 [Eumeta japonica]|uniref:Uncharacterized protein n=1 Tax=Eumeta variegata TaxID=151549 RepID=A0A4C1U6C4_EUMVA|nr:hypothetical protein EVAR_11987_1 [Eumeta japonica]